MSDLIRALASPQAMDEYLELHTGREVVDHISAELEAWRQQYDEATTNLWLTGTKLHAAESRLDKALGIIHDLLGLERGSADRAMEFLDENLPTAQEVRGALPLPPSDRNTP